MLHSCRQCWSEKWRKNTENDKISTKESLFSKNHKKWFSKINLKYLKRNFKQYYEIKMCITEMVFDPHSSLKSVLFSYNWSYVRYFNETEKLLNNSIKNVKSSL